MASRNLNKPGQGRDHEGGKPFKMNALTVTGLSKTTTSSQSEIFSSYNNIYNNSSDCETYTSSQSEITTDYDASSEPSSRETSRPSSPESGNLTTRTLYLPTPEMAIIHKTMHDAIPAVRD